MVSKKTFEDFGLQQVDALRHQGEKYFRRHINRLYQTYRECAALIRDGERPRIVSLGAGSAFVEMALVNFHGVQMEIAEFPEAIALNRELYDRFGIRGIEADLSKGIHLEGEYDIILSCEIMEHIPLPPSTQIAMVIEHLRPGGYLLITTPNLRRVELIADLIKGKPIMPQPEKFFATTGFENEGIHRREYLAPEIIQAMGHCGLAHCRTRFIWNEPLRHFRRFKRIVYFPFELFFPFFRRIMILVGQKPQVI